MTVFVEITNLLEKAARNGTKAHLGAGLARALIGSPAYPILLAERTKEIAASWREESLSIPPACSSAPSGSGTAPSEMNGASAGTMTAEDQEIVGRAASRRASKAVEMVARRGRRKTPSQLTTSPRSNP